MPIFDYECPNCGIISDFWAKIDEYKHQCPKCKGEMERILSPTRIICDLKPYWDHEMAASPVYVQSRQDRRQKMADLGVFGYGDTPKASQKFEEERQKRIEPKKKLWGK